MDGASKGRAAEDGWLARTGLIREADSSFSKTGSPILVTSAR